MVMGRRVRERRAGQSWLIDQVDTLAAQLGAVTEQLTRAGRQHADLAAAVSEDLAPRGQRPSPAGQR